MGKLISKAQGKAVPKAEKAKTSDDKAKAAKPVSTAAKPKVDTKPSSDEDEDDFEKMSSLMRYGMIIDGDESVCIFHLFCSLCNFINGVSWFVLLDMLEASNDSDEDSSEEEDEATPENALN
ncbi:hypothetical protein FRX31_005600, partial [Thalictrum thalictroides]